MLGGGTFTSQNKILPGAYMNFVSTKSASSELSDRGIATMPLELEWGVEGEIFEVSNSDFANDTLKIFGYHNNHEKMKGLRDLFKNITTLYAYRLNNGGSKASNTYATAKFSGVRGNDLKIVIQKNVDDESLYDVKTVLDTTIVDTQTVSVWSELKSNDFVTFSTSGTLSVTAATPLSGGTNGTIDGASHQAYLDKIESYSYNTMGVVTTEETVKSMYVNFCSRMRDEIGAKFQVVIYNKAADYEGVINVKNKVTDADVSEASLVYWVTGAIAGCAINKSVLNKIYDGEFTVDVDYTQKQLENAIKSGEFTLHKVGSDIRVLEDINSLVTTTDVKGDVFKDNQTIRIIDQIANDIAVLFNTKYLGNIPNDQSGRTSFWVDVVKHHETLQNNKAIENFNDTDVTVEQGSDRKSVVVHDAITPIGTMTKLYSTTVIR
ncbi:MAG: phage tail sheath family protein [Clostridia bacterium]|nr:phage tail sheath family protein [Clostridia bacterium]